MEPPIPQRPALVLLSPVWPAAGGYGLAMRAGLFLDALAVENDVTLLLLPVFGETATVPDFVRQRARRVARVDLAPGLDPLFALSDSVRDPAARSAALAAYPRPQLCRFATGRIRAACRDAAFAAEVAPPRAVVLRSYLAPYAEPFLGTAGSVLDLDDDEAVTRRRLAALHRRYGRNADADLEELEASKFERLEAIWVARFATVLACSAGHAERLAARFPSGRFEVVPNAAPAFPSVPRETASKEWRLLFVGNLSYAPNEDAALWLCDEILPALRARSDAPVAVRLVGARPGPRVRALGERPGVALFADPVQVAAHYAWADLALVPLRAGGGTRIKILEAFAAGVPVVSTTIGAEGLEVASDTHLLRGDTTDEIATACLRLRTEPGLAEALVAASGVRLAERYAQPVVAARLRAVLTG